jgi:hypothetical protein
LSELWTKKVGKPRFGATPALFDAGLWRRSLGKNSQLLAAHRLAAQCLVALRRAVVRLRRKLSASGVTSVIGEATGMNQNAWVRVGVFSATVVLACAYVHWDIGTRLEFAKHGRNATATVVKELDEIRRAGSMEYVVRVEYEGRTARLESKLPLPVGSQVEIQYVPRPKRDLVRVANSAGVPLGSIFMLVLGGASVLVVVQELRGRSWWDAQAAPGTRALAHPVMAEAAPSPWRS